MGCVSCYRDVTFQATQKSLSVIVVVCFVSSMLLCIAASFFFSSCLTLYNDVGVLLTIMMNEIFILFLLKVTLCAVFVLSAVWRKHLGRKIITLLIVVVSTFDR